MVYCIKTTLTCRHQYARCLYTKCMNAYVVHCTCLPVHEATYVRDSYCVRVYTYFLSPSLLELMVGDTYPNVTVMITMIRYF